MYEGEIKMSSGNCINLKSSGYFGIPDGWEGGNKDNNNICRRNQ